MPLLLSLTQSGSRTNKAPIIEPAANFRTPFRFGILRPIPAGKPLEFRNPERAPLSRFRSRDGQPRLDRGNGRFPHLARLKRAVIE